MTKLIQVNLHHSRAASASLCRTFTQGNFDLALIQEPWISQGRVAGLGDARGNIIYCKDINNPRTCILVKGGLQCFPLVEFCSRDLTTIHFQSMGDRLGLLVSSAYLPYDAKELPPTQELRLLVDHSNLCKLHLLVGCDSNAHHLEGWGSSNTNRRGESLLDFLLANNLQIANVGNSHTFINRLRGEVIDITFCSQKVSDLIKGWHVSNEASLSDHRYIIFSIGCCNESLHFRNPRNTDWVGYSEQLTCMTKSLSLKIQSSLDLEQTAFSLKEAIVNSFNDNCPQQLRQQSVTVRWWNHDLSKLRAVVRRQFNYSKANGDWRAYHTALTAYSLAIKKAKRASWRRFTREVNSLKEVARLQKVLASKPLNPVGSLQRPDGQYTKTARETLDTLLKTHFPGCLAGDQQRSELIRSDNYPRPRAVRSDWDLALQVVTLSKVCWAIDHFGPYKSPGADGIYPVLLQKAPHMIKRLICELLRASVALGYIPTAWRVSKVVFIPKRGRSDYSKAKAFRPISLSSFILKTLERLVDRFLRDRVLLGQPLHRKQHAYQAGKSCMSALNDLVSRAEDALDCKEIALCAFLDIEGAFDNISHDAIIRAAKERGTHPVISRWLDALLQSRSIKSTLLNETLEVSTVRGCPQGGVLSPLLWNLVVDGLLTQITNTGTHIQGYADDIVIMVRGRFMETVADVMNEKLKEVLSWCSREGLNVNPAKTTVLPFTRIRNLTALGRLNMNGVHLEVSRSVKFLGVTLDQKLTWNPHLDNVLHKAKWALLTSRRFIGSNWGLKPYMAFWLYKMVISPQLLYGALVWWPKTEQQVARQRLATLQRLACLYISGAFISTPTAALEVLLGLLPLDVSIKLEAMKAAYRLASSGLLREGRTQRGHSAVLRSGQISPVLDMAPDVMSKTFVFTRPFSVIVEPRSEWTDETVAQITGLVWYTDGSVINGKAGCGVYGAKPRTALTSSLGKLCTIFQAEIRAILDCAYLGIAKGFKGARITILSDSQAALRALSSNVMTSKLVWECFHALCALSRLNNVVLRWVPGHRGFLGNENADQLAKKGALTPFVGPEPTCGISWSTAKAVLHDWARTTHLQRWRGTRGQSLLKELLREPSISLSSFLRRQERVNLRLALAYLTGHGQFRSHLAKLGLYNGDTTCRLCGQSEETAAHLLTDCEPIESSRRGIFGGSAPGGDVGSCIGDQILRLAKVTGIP